MFFRNAVKQRQVDAVDTGAVEACADATSLLEELAADPHDFVDLASILKLDLDAVVAALVQGRHRTSAALLAALRPDAPPAPAAAAGETAATSDASTTPAPVWTRVALDRRGAVGTVYAGWLTPGAIEEIAGVAGAAGAETQVEITVALADDEARLAHVRALCGQLDTRLAHAQQSGGDARRRSGLSWGSGGERGWGRWARARGGARAHRDAFVEAP